MPTNRLEVYVLVCIIHGGTCTWGYMYMYFIFLLWVHDFHNCKCNGSSLARIGLGLGIDLTTMVAGREGGRGKGVERERAFIPTYFVSVGLPIEMPRQKPPSWLFMARLSASNHKAGPAQQQTPITTNLTYPLLNTQLTLFSTHFFFSSSVESLDFFFS